MVFSELKIKHVLWALVVVVAGCFCFEKEISSLVGENVRLKVLDEKMYGIIIDAGSSGSRVHVFVWNAHDIFSTLSEVSRLKINPGISSYAKLDGGYQKAGKSLKGLIQHAKSIVPAHLYAKTKIYLLATAGMRLLDEKDQKGILVSVRQQLSNSPFLFQPDYARVIKGSKEALYA